MLLDKTLKIPGWMTEQELIFLAENASKLKSIVEIGSWRGRSARAMADNSSAVLFCVDTWSDAAVGYSGWWTVADNAAGLYLKPNWLWSEFKSNVLDHVGHKILPLRMLSNQAAGLLGVRPHSFDMVFIDAGHTYKEVVDDINLWRPLVKSGGLLCGHDYNEPTCPEVAPAVDSVFKTVDIVGTIWSTRRA